MELLIYWQILRVLVSQLDELRSAADVKSVIKPPLDERRSAASPPAVARRADGAPSRPPLSRSEALFSSRPPLSRSEALFLAGATSQLCALLGGMLRTHGASLGLTHGEVT